MKNQNDASNAIRVLADVIGKNRTLLLTLTAIVVFVVSYLLVLPALTLDEEEAASQGGIDVPASGQEVDQNDTEENNAADAEENDADDEDKDAFSADNAGASPEEMSFEGEGYSISASADSDAQLPDGTELTAQEITEEDKDYEAWKDEALKALQVAGEAEENASLDTARFYDITLLADGQNVEPAAPVNVTISYDKAIRLRADDLRVIHFAVDEDGELVPEILDGSSVEISAKKGSQGTGTGNITQSPDNLQNLVLQVQITVIRMRFLFFQAFQPSIISGRGDMKYPAYTGNVHGMRSVRFTVQIVLHHFKGICFYGFLFEDIEFSSKNDWIFFCVSIRLSRYRIRAFI